MAPLGRGRRGPLLACQRPASTMTTAKLARPTEKTTWVCVVEKPKPPSAIAALSLGVNTLQA